MPTLTRRVLIALAFAAAMAAAFGDAAADDDRPNILLVLTDDQGYGDLGLHGHPDIATPHLDRFANESVRLDRFTAQPVCAPTRACLMTGRHHLAVGVWGVHGGRDYLNLGVPTVAGALRDAGYATAFAGKWHLGKTQAYLPHNRGFSDAWTITDRLYEHTDPVLNHNGRDLRPKGWTPEILTDLALAFIDRVAAEAEPTGTSAPPWFVYLAHPSVHEPFYAPDRLVRRHLESGLAPSYATLCAMVEHLDEQAGRLFAGLAERGLDRDTVVVFLGDNGPIGNPVNLPHLTEAEMARRNPLGLRGVKGNVYDNGVRVPAFFRWPGRWTPSVSTAVADITDVAPTLLDLAGLDPDRLEPDGVSLRPLLEGETIATPPRLIVHANHEAVWPERRRLYDFLADKTAMRFEDQVLAARRGPHKLVTGWGRRELFDTSLDPGETIDLAGARPGVAAALEAELRDWWEGVHASPASYGMPTFVVGTPGQTELLLHGGAPSRVAGGVRTESHTADDWAALGDAAAWAVRVERPGPYRARLDAAWGEAPCRLELRAGGETVRFDAGETGWRTLPVGRAIEEIELRLIDGQGATPVIRSLRGVILTVDP